jgi:site-specific DNA-methyltransferase (adenine-specific)
MAVGIEDAGFEIRDMIAWVYGSGFPKSMNVSKAMSKDTSSQWLGWGTALKPALEPITVARKPLSSTVVDNVLEHGTGALNIDGCRTDSCGDTSADGRWPANLIHDGGAEISSLLGNAARFFYCPKTSKTDRNEGCGALEVRAAGECTERVDGSDGMNSPRAGAGRTCGNRNHHPTVKPTELMRFLCRLTTQPGGMVLDPFMGSGSTGKAAVLEGFGFIGIEREIEYITIARARIEYAEKLCRILP